MIPNDTEVGNLPEPTHGDKTFAGWYKESTYDTAVSTDTIISNHTTFYAKWN